MSVGKILYMVSVPVGLMITWASTGNAGAKLRKAHTLCSPSVSSRNILCRYTTDTPIVYLWETYSCTCFLIFSFKVKKKRQVVDTVNEKQRREHTHWHTRGFLEKTHVVINPDRLTEWPPSSFPLLSAEIREFDQLSSVINAMAARGLWVWRWESIGLNLTATAAGRSGALLYTGMADILPQETNADLNGK